MHRALQRQPPGYHPIDRGPAGHAAPWWSDIPVVPAAPRPQRPMARGPMRMHMQRARMHADHVHAHTHAHTPAAAHQPSVTHRGTPPAPGAMPGLPRAAHTVAAGCMLTSCRRSGLNDSNRHRRQYPPRPRRPDARPDPRLGARGHDMSILGMRMRTHTHAAHTHTCALRMHAHASRLRGTGEHGQHTPRPPDGVLLATAPTRSPW